MAEAAPVRRLFVGLWPQPAVRAALAAVAATFPADAGRPVPAGNLHLTLCFLGACTPAREACVREVLGGLDGSPFTLSVDCVGWFPGARAAWLAPTVRPPALAALQRAMAEALAGCGIAPEARAFAPHVTVLRHCPRPVPAAPFAPVHWPVSGFALLESRPVRGATGYRPLGRWPLRPPAG